ncbi:MAG TPA: SURF1 family protein [Gemmatimonadaceae bacterium]|nr:SURF1 family protein [Gemmatimonadaceae bacterium]
MSRSAIIAAVIALAMATVFARLGVWQVHRLHERQALNAELVSRISLPPTSVAELPADTALAAYRLVKMSGRYDYEHQIILTGRSRGGAPGVYIVTPLIPDSGGTAVLVNRGFVYSPDAATISVPTWYEPEHATVEGYARPVPVHEQSDPRSERNPMAWRDLDSARVAEAIPYPVARMYVVNLTPGERSLGAPTRVSAPSLDEGPHKSYAIQWFSFAAIALYGVGYLVWLETRKKRGVTV